MGKVVAVCVSSCKGTSKKSVKQIELRNNWGIVGDAHAGHWHRQISLLASERIAEMKEKGKNVEFGSFGENIATAGCDLKTLPVGTKLQINGCLLELSQIGKACHSHCQIYQEMGDCIMPREGVFAEVLKGGVIRPGDEITVHPADAERPFTAAVITLSDRASRGIYQDLSGPLIRKNLTENGYKVIEQLILPDEKAQLAQELCRLADQRQVNVIFTTGGTGFAPRDHTPEATREVSEREVPGIGEALRANAVNFTKHAILSRQTAGIRRQTLIINLPGKPSACQENLDYLLPILPHGLNILRGTATEG